MHLQLQSQTGDRLQVNGLSQSYRSHILGSLLSNCNILHLFHIHCSLKSNSLRQSAYIHPVAGKTPHGAPGKARGLNSPHYLHGIEKPHVNTDGPDDIGENFISHFATFLLLVPWIYSVLFAIVAPWMPRPQSASVSWYKHLRLLG